MNTTINVGNEYRSDSGRGTNIARVMRIDGDTIHLERWDMTARHTRRGTKFTLSRHYMESPICGWKLVQKKGTP